MEILRESSEDEMILEFLKAEYSSVRFSGTLAASMKRLGMTEKLITDADLCVDAENRQRQKLLGDFRGYGENRELFERFPKVSEWTLCRFSGNDLEHIRYIDYSYWNELSKGTGKPLVAAETITNGTEIFGVSNEGFLRAAEYIKNGGCSVSFFAVYRKKQGRKRLRKQRKFYGTKIIREIMLRISLG